MYEEASLPPSEVAAHIGEESESVTTLRGATFLAESWGWIGVVATDRGLRLLALPRRTADAAVKAITQDYPDLPLGSEDPLLVETAQQVRAFLAADLRMFTLPLDLRGHTSFALSVWAAACSIGYGQTRAYRWIARQVGGGRGISQAVGAALGSNPVPLIIPCHRVVGSDGSLHGYAGGLQMKARLLAMESGQASLL